MMKSLILIVLIVSANSCCSNVVCPEKDDRMVDHPYQDSILGNLISDYKTMILPYYEARNKCDMEDSVFYLTLNFHTRNDSNIIWSMGAFEEPLILHDSICNNQNFIGYFKREKDYCFLYRNLFRSESSNPSPCVISNLLKGWKLRNEDMDPHLFHYGLCQDVFDPIMIEYSIDSVGYIKQLRIVRW